MDFWMIREYIEFLRIMNQKMPRAYDASLEPLAFRLCYYHPLTTADSMEG